MADELLLIDVWVDATTESLYDVVTRVVTMLEFVVPLCFFVEVLSDVVSEALVVAIDVDVLPGVVVNVSAAAITALKVFMSMPWEECSC